MEEVGWEVRNTRGYEGRCTKTMGEGRHICTLDVGGARVVGDSIGSAGS